MSPQGMYTLGARHGWAQGSVLGVFNKLPRRNQLFIIVHPCARSHRPPHSQKSGESLSSSKGETEAGPQTNCWGCQTKQYAISELGKHVFRKVQPPF